jgi:hypothetical protein
MSWSLARRNCLTRILAMSRDNRIDHLDAVVPNLMSACGSRTLHNIQEAWCQINQRCGVRIVTAKNQDLLIAGAELLNRGVEVRVAPSLTRSHITYYLFGGDIQCVVSNQHGSLDTIWGKPEKAALSKVFSDHFHTLWSSSVPLETLLAEQVSDDLSRVNDCADFAHRVRELRVKYRLNHKAEQAILRHVAFWRDAQVIFITGLPGAGKSFVRRRLARKLAESRFQVDEQSDYVYAFDDFLHTLLRFNDGHGGGFSAEARGFFR